VTTVLLVGLGPLGGQILDVLARDVPPWRLVAAGRDAGRGLARVTVARLAAAALGRAPVVEFVRLDVEDTEAAAAVVARVQPDIVVAALTRQTWWLRDLLPEAEAAALAGARFGAWLPVHLAPTLRLLEVLRVAGYSGPVVTAAYPDVVNVVCARVGFAPWCGLGNIDEIEPKVRLAAAARLGVAPAAITVTLVAHHALERFVFAAGGAARAEAPPYFLRVDCNGEDVTAAAGGEALLFAPCPLPATPAWHTLTAASAVRLLRALRRETPTRRHAPAPEGLPGGYPVVASRAGVRAVVPAGLSREAAIAINERAQRWDGIAGIEPDGTVVVCDEDADVLRRVLGYDGARVRPGEADARARELAARFREYARRAGVDVDRVRSRLS
jgi:hypothetical protein